MVAPADMESANPVPIVRSGCARGAPRERGRAGDRGAELVARHLAGERVQQLRLGLRGAGRDEQRGREDEDGEAGRGNDQSAVRLCTHDGDGHGGPHEGEGNQREAEKDSREDEREK